MHIDKELVDLDLRQEVLDLISGEDFGSSKFIPFIARLIRKDSASNSIRCTCWNNVSKEGRIDCPSCDGVGSLWDERIIPGFFYSLSFKSVMSSYRYSNESSRSEDSEFGFVTPYNIHLNTGDFILVPKLTDEGVWTSPIQVAEKYGITSALQKRLDHGKVEFVSVTLTRIS